jgi:IS5 family transposase
MLKGVVASHYLGVKSTAAIVRRLQEDETLTLACGFNPKDIPHRTTFSRFIGKVRRHQDLLDKCLNTTTSELRVFLPGFGEVVAVDSTPVRTHSNPRKERVSDPQAGWIVKEGDGEHKEYHFGYKLHAIVDVKYELPLFKKQTMAEVQDVEMMMPLLKEARETLPWFAPEAVLGDRGYDSHDNFEGIVKDFHADPIIPLVAKGGGSVPDVTGTPAAPQCAAGLPLIYRGWDKSRGLKYQCPEVAGKAFCPMLFKCDLADPKRILWVRPVHDYRRFGHRIKRGTEEWKETYRKRVAAERVFSGLKDFRRLEAHCFRYFDRINTHTTLSVLTMQAMALAEAKAGRIERVRVRARQVG